MAMLSDEPQRRLCVAPVGTRKGLSCVVKDDATPWLYKEVVVVCSWRAANDEMELMKHTVVILDENSKAFVIFTKSSLQPSTVSHFPYTKRN